MELASFTILEYTHTRAHTHLYISVYIYMHICTHIYIYIYERDNALRVSFIKLIAHEISLF